VDLKQLISKYSMPGPRYTSYPTAPIWKNEHGVSDYQTQLRGCTNSDKPLALYFHIPFCESLCYYCGCNIKITKDHSGASIYVSALLNELASVKKKLGANRKIHQICWGGGTPTFLSSNEMDRLHRGTLELFEIVPDAEVSIEVDPRVTSFEQLNTLRTLGFNRISLGVQDFNPVVQKAVNRVQSLEQTRGLFQRARDLGFTRNNFDLIYGLPYQTLASFEETVREVIAIKPDRIALYNYAHLPGMIKHQTILDEMPMPSAEARVDIFSMAYNLLTANGYEAIGMDHFALKTDELYTAIESGSLYRNFMGYTVKKGSDLIGIGASAIGEVGDAYFQNVKEVKKYQAAVQNGDFATLRGCLLSADDVRRKWVIQRLMCNFQISPALYYLTFGESFDDKFGSEWANLDAFEADGILQEFDSEFRVTDRGRLFVRNVAMLFDAYLKEKPKRYSSTV
jgi:oxygen-independent coproporphyrinogen-3 oxidase